MFVGHEVGHALFTPNEDLYDGIPHSFVNIVEDVPIEKLMKRRYAGLQSISTVGTENLLTKTSLNLKVLISPT